MKNNKLIIDMYSIEEQYFFNYQNLRYGERHYNDFSEEHILEMEIKNNKNVKVKIRYYDDNYHDLRELSISLDNKGRYLNSKCDCSFHRSNYPCGHIWIIVHYLNDNEFFIPYTYKDKNCMNIDKFLNDFYIKKKLREGRIRSKLFVDMIIDEEMKSYKSMSDKASVKLEVEFYELSNYSGNFKLRYRIGNDKMYLVKNLIDKLLSPLKNNSYVDYGKEFKTILDYEIFDEESKKELDFLRNNINCIDKNTLEINHSNIDEFYELHKNNGGIQNLFIEEKDFGLKLELSSIQEFYELNILDEKASLSEEEFEKLVFDKINDEYEDLYISPSYLEQKVREVSFELLNKKYFTTNNRFYNLDFIDGQAILFYMDTNKDESKFYDVITGNNICFTKDELNEVINNYKNKLERIRISDEILKEFSDEILIKPELYCDITEDMHLVLNLKYKNIKANLYFKKLISKLEYAGLDNLNKLNNEAPNKKYDIDEIYKVTKDKMVVEFIEYIIPSLTEDADIYLSDSIKNYSYTKTLNLSVGVKVKSNLLSIEFMSDDIDPKEIYDILSRYRKNKKYYKMKSGQIIKLDDIQIENIDNFLKDMGIDDKELKKSKIEVPQYRRFRLSEEHSINVETDDKFKNLFKNKKTKINKKYENILRKYQKEGVEFLLNLRNMKLGGLLADDMGLGKSLQVIALIESVQNREKPILIVSPSSLILNWENEFHKFGSGLNIKVIHGNKDERRNLIKEANTKLTDEVLITSYDYLKRDLDLYEDIIFDTVVIDEAQYIKNYKTKAAKAVKKIKRDNSIALTGTPIENSLAEIWSVFDFLMSGYLFNYNKFSKNYERPIVLNDDEKASKRLKSMVEPFILRRLKKDVLTELPSKIEETYYIELNEEEQELYKANLYDINMKLSQKEKNNKVEILSMLTRLRQICIDSNLVYDKVFNESSKIKASMDIIEQAVLGGQKILVFSSFTRVLDTIAEKSRQNGFAYFMLTGSTNKLKRKEYVDRFQNGEVPIFLISLKAGGTGLNLTEASLVIHIDPWWNISAQNQATDRAYRIGQKNVVQVISLIAKNTIEEKIQKMQENKKMLSDTFVENSSGSFSKMNEEELMSLLKME